MSVKTIRLMEDAGLPSHIVSAICDLVEEKEQLQQQLREKEARIARLQKAGWVLVDAKPFNTEQVHKAVEILKESPPQSLAHIRADAVEGVGVYLYKIYADTSVNITIYEYAQQLRDKADEPTA